MDAAYNITKEGGGNHRLFDNGHDIFGAWEQVKGASPDDEFMSEVMGYMKGLWNDLSTSKGLPFDTIEKDSYDKFASWVTENTPFDREWAYDLLSFDAGEILASSLGVAAVVFALKKDDIEKVSETLGSLGIVSIATANPIMGFVTVFAFCYSYFIKKQQLDKKMAFKSIATTGLSLSLFSLLGFTGFFFVLEIGIVFFATKALKNRVLDNEELFQNIKEKWEKFRMDKGQEVEPKPAV